MEYQYLATLKGGLKLIEIFLSTICWSLIGGTEYGHSAREFPLVLLVFSWLLNW